MVFVEMQNFASVQMALSLLVFLSNKVNSFASYR